MEKEIIAKLMDLEKEIILTVSHDYFSYADSPREWDNLGTFYTWESRYNSPDKQNSYNDLQEFFEYHLGENVVDREMKKAKGGLQFLESMIQKLNKIGIIAEVVSRFEHGNVCYSLGYSTGWDTGVIGIIFAEKEKIYAEYNVKKVTAKVKEKTLSVFAGELENYTDWVNGEVYCVEVADLNGEVIDCCGGCYGLDYVLGGGGYLGNHAETFDEDKLNNYLAAKEIYQGPKQQAIA